MQIIPGRNYEDTNNRIYQFLHIASQYISAPVSKKSHIQVLSPKWRVPDQLIIVNLPAQIREAELFIFAQCLILRMVQSNSYYAS